MDRIADQAIEFVRDASGRVNWVRVVGRVAVRIGVILRTQLRGVILREPERSDRPLRVILREPERSDRRPKDRSRAKAVATALDGQRSFVASLLRMTRGGGYAPQDDLERELGEAL